MPVVGEGHELPPAKALGEDFHDGGKTGLRGEAALHGAGGGTLGGDGEDFGVLNAGLEFGG